MNVLVGVTGCIAIYKAVGLISLLRKQGYDLRVVMTESAEKMVSKDVFSAVGGCPVYTDQDAFSISDGWIPHTELSKWADILVIAPATANTASKLAHGIADNLLSLTCLAYEKPARIIVPAMNVRMYENPVTKRNLDILKQDGWIVLEPEIGHLACGETGSGRYPDNEFILEAIRIATCKKIFSGQKLLITAGPTSEPLDPVRVLTNRSSGKTGYTLATVAKRLGAKVCLISGPVCQKRPYFVDEFIEVETAEQMYKAVIEKFDESDAVIMAAAVADYRPKSYANSKIKKDFETLSVSLKKTIDILQELSLRKNGKILVGFALETDNLEHYAREKMAKKNLDLVVANDCSVIGEDKAEVILIRKDGSIKRVGPDAKDSVALVILSELANFWSGSQT